MSVNFKCGKCGKVKVIAKTGGIGYAIMSVTDPGEAKKVCYACCAILDKERMIKDGKMILYLTTINEINTNYSSFNKPICTYRAKLTNWPGTLEFKAFYSIGRHNWGLKRYDVWFKFDGYIWHGVTIGDNTQLCHCRKTKQTKIWWMHS